MSRIAASSIPRNSTASSVRQRSRRAPSGAAAGGAGSRRGRPGTGGAVPGPATRRHRPKRVGIGARHTLWVYIRLRRKIAGVLTGVLGFVLRRLRRRTLQVALLAVALAAAAALVGSAGLIAALSSEHNIRHRLGSLPVGETEVLVQARVEAPSLKSPVRAPELEALGRRTVDVFSEVVAARRQARFWDPILPADENGIRFIEVQDLADSVALVSGRLPRGCGAMVCEAVSLSRAYFPLGATVPLGGSAR